MEGGLNKNLCYNTELKNKHYQIPKPFHSFTVSRKKYTKYVWYKILRLTKRL